MRIWGQVQDLGQDEGAVGEGWNLAARLWAEGRAQAPARVFTDADLFAATAAFHGHEFATCEVGLVEVFCPQTVNRGAVNGVTSPRSTLSTC